MTISPTISRIPGTEAIVYKYVHQQITPGGPKDFDGFAALNGTFTLVTIPEDYAVAGVRIRNLVRFQGPSITSVTVSVGATNGATTDNTFYAPAYELVLNVTDRSIQLSSPFAAYSANAHSIFTRFVATGANLNVLTAGSVEIAIRCVPLLG